VALLSRFYPDPQNDHDRHELVQIMGSAFRHHPDLMTEMMVDQLPTLAELGSAARLLPSWDFIRADGPICTSAIRGFARKLGLVLHYHCIKKIAPPGGGVLFIPYTNVEMMTEGVPVDLAYLFGDPQTLRMGRQHVGEQFRYGSVRQDDYRLTCHFAAFREALGMLLFVAVDMRDFEQLEHFDPRDVLPV
jgi:hypothetical protein